MVATTANAYQLFHEGTIALAQVEANGIRIDTDYLAKATKQVTRQIKELDEELKQDKVWKIWTKVYGTQANITSRPQLAEVLFSKMGFPCTAWTKGGKKGEKKPSTDEAHLKTVNLPFVDKYLEMAKLEKVRGTYLGGIAREVDSNGFLHPSFNLASSSGYGDDDRGGARSFRGSCSLPNFQNMPIRNKKQGKTIRQCFIPRPDNVLLEVDFGGIEVRIAACYHKDPTMLRYIEDPSTDMHRDMASECYLLDFTDWDKEAYKLLRYCAKNKYVFPEFYGSVYFQCAPALWDAIDQMKLVTPDGKSVKEHLANKGIKSLGLCNPQTKPKPSTFEYHIWKVEQDFWGRRFRVYAQWKDRWYHTYRDKGYFDLLTGFRIAGWYKRNEVINLPVQGVAFHCLLWSLIKVQKYLLKHAYVTRIVGQIHDSLLFDGPKEEIITLLPIIKKIMTEKIRKVWSWICVPLEVEADITPVNGSWHDKAPIRISV